MSWVLYVIQQREYSGAETAQLPLLRADRDALVACPAGSATEALARSAGAATIDLPFRTLRSSAGWLETVRSLWRGLLAARDLRRVLRAHPQRRLIFSTSLRPALIASLAASGLGRHTIWTVSDFLPPPPLRGAVRTFALLLRPTVIAHSRAIADDFVGGRRRLRPLVHVVHPGIDVARFREPPDGERAPAAAVVGHISPTKRTDLALGVAAAVVAQRPGFRLDVIGRALYREEDFEFEAGLRERASGDERLRSAVRFLGHQPDVQAALASVSMLLHCRPDEPFGMVLIEAMATGLPVVAPAAAGPLEIVTDGETGLLYPPGDAVAAAECVLALLADSERAHAMGRAGRQAALERFSSERYLRDTQRVFAATGAQGRNRL